jgi:thymidylate synthase
MDWLCQCGEINNNHKTKCVWCKQLKPQKFTPCFFQSTKVIVVNNTGVITIDNEQVYSKTHKNFKQAKTQTLKQLHKLIKKIKSTNDS